MTILPVQTSAPGNPEGAITRGGDMGDGAHAGAERAAVASLKELPREGENSAACIMFSEGVSDKALVSRQKEMNDPPTEKAPVTIF